MLQMILVPLFSGLSSPVRVRVTFLGLLDPEDEGTIILCYLSNYLSTDMV
jgi:hypothetical protein